MGTFRETIEIANPVKPTRKIALEALVDTGATYTWIPAKFLKTLRIKSVETRRVKIADGRVLDRKMGIIDIWVKGKRTPTWVLFGDNNTDPLLGAVTLEELGFAVDPIHRELIPATAYLVFFRAQAKTVIKSGRRI